MSSTTTACILLCIACMRTIISSSIDDEYETVIRAISGLLAGIAVHFAAAPTLSLGGDGKDRLGRRHRTDDSKITTIFTLLSLYALFDIFIARHVVWGVFPYLGWTTSSVLQSSQGELGERSRDRPSTDTRSRRNDSTLARTTERRRRSKNSGGAVHDQDSSPRLISIGPSATTPGPHLDRGIKPEHENETFEDFTFTASAANNVNDLYQYGSKSVKVYPPESRSTPPLRYYGNRSRVGSSHVTFIDTASTTRPHITTIYEDSAKISGELAKNKKAADSGIIKNVLTWPDIAREATTTAAFFPLTRDNLQRITRAPDESDKYKTLISDERLTFYTAESTEWDSDSDSEYTLAWKTVQSGASSSTAKAPSTLSVEEILNPSSYDLAIAEDMDDDLGVAEESSSNVDSDTDNAVVRFHAAQNQIAESIEYRPDLIPRDYVSQTYIRVEKFVSAVDGIELAEQIEVIPEPQETAYDQSDLELRRQRRHLKHLLIYEPSETSSSTTVRLSELEGNMRAIDQRAEEHRRKGIEAKRKASALGEKRRLALSNRRSDEAFRMKCVMREYAEEAAREDKKAAKLFFRARNRPGASRIDVHSLRKEEALKAVEKALREVQLKGGHQLHVIVGQGIHSVNGKPVLKPFLKSALQAQAMRVYESSNPGMLVVNMS